MKILVVSTNTIKTPTPVVPLGAGMIYASIRAHGYRAEFLDMAFLEQPLSSLTKGLMELEPDIICLSIRNIDNQAIQGNKFYLSFLKQVVITCRSFSHAKIIVGGAAMFVMPFEIMNYLGADYGIMGYGEREIIRLLRDIERNITQNESNKLRTTKNFFDPILSRMPNKEIFDERYFTYDVRVKKAAMGYQTSRGCSNKCVYCPTGCSSEGFCRVSPEQLDYDMDMLTNGYKINKVTFTDEVFNQDLESAIGLCNQLVGKSKGLQWTCSLIPSLFSEELVAYMKKAGCVYVDMGIDTASDEMLKNMGKGFQVDGLLSLGALLEKYEIPYSISLLFGGPGENIETVKETVKNINRLNPIFVLASYGIRLYPRTGLYQIALGEGVVNEGEDMLRPRFYQSTQISIESIKAALGDSRHHCKDMLMNTIGGE